MTLADREDGQEKQGQGQMDATVLERIWPLKSWKA